MANENERYKYGKLWRGIVNLLGNANVPLEDKKIASILKAKPVSVRAILYSLKEQEVVENSRSVENIWFAVKKDTEKVDVDKV